MPISESVKPSTNSRPVTLTLADFSGGLNAEQSAYPLALAETEVSDILNFKYIKTPKGVKLKSRDGLTLVTTGGINNYALNPGFETAGGGGVDVFGSWSEYASDGQILRASVATGYPVRSGTYCCVLISGPNKNTFVYQDFVCYPTEQIIFEFYAYDNGVAGRYSVWDITNSAYIVPQTVYTTTASSWSKTSVKFTVPAGCLSFRIYLYSPDSNGAGSIIDDVVINRSILDIGYYVTSTGVAYIMAVINNAINYLSSGSFTQIGDLSSSRGRMVQFNDKLIIADGSDLKYWDGTTFGYLTDEAYAFLDYGSATPTSILPLYTGGSTRAGLHITMTVDFQLKKVSFLLHKNGTPPGTCVAKVFASDGSTVLGTSATVDCSTLSATLRSDILFTFSTAVSLTSGSAYYIVVVYDDVGSSITNTVVISSHNSDIIQGEYSSYDGSWDDFTGYDPLIRMFGASPFASLVIHKQNRIYCNNTVYPNRLYYCNANDPSDWSTEDGSGYIIFDGHYKINALAVFYDEIYIFCDNPKAVYRMSGDSPLEYSVKKLFVDVTAISQDAVQNVGVDLLFVDSRGLISMKTMREYGDIEKAIVSRDINSTYLLPYAGQITGKLEVDNQFWMTITSNKVAVFDVQQGVWTIYQFELGTGITPTSFGIINGVTYLGSSDGNLYYMDYTKDQDNGVDFNLSVLFPWNDFGTLMVKTGRFADSLLISAEQESYDFEIYTDFNSITAKKVLSQVSLSQNGAFHSPYCGNLNEVNFNFNQIQFKLTNIASSKGPYWLDRIVFEGSILSRFV